MHNKTNKIPLHWVNEMKEPELPTSKNLLCGTCGGVLKEEYLFSWDDIPENDNLKLIEFLMQNFDIDWVKAAKIEKIDNDKTIRVSTEKNLLLLKLRFLRNMRTFL